MQRGGSDSSNSERLFPSNTARFGEPEDDKLKSPKQSLRTLRDAVSGVALHPVAHHARAPAMPAPNETSKMPCLPFTPRTNRFLREIVQIPSDEFTEAIDKYLTTLPNIAVSGDQLSHFMLPKPGTMGYPKAIGMFDNGVQRWTDSVLGLAQNVLETIDTSLDQHGFGPDRGGNMACGWGNQNWGAGDFATHKISEVKVVTVTMPPWCFAPQDMIEFSQARPFVNPACFTEDDRVAVASADKLWARLHDFCNGHNSHYFIVSTYEEWVFGCFTKHWSTGFVGPILSHDSQNPTAFEAILCWLHSAHGHPSGFEIPKIFAEFKDIPSLRPSASLKVTGKRKRDDDDDEDVDGRAAVKKPRRIFQRVPWLPQKPPARKKKNTKHYFSSLLAKSQLPPVSEDAETPPITRVTATPPLTQVTATTLITPASYSHDMFGSLVPDLTDPYVSSWDASTATTGLELQTGAEMLGSSAPWDVSGGGFDMIFTAPHTLPAHWAEDAVTQNNAGAPGFDYNFDVDLTTLQEITDQWLADNPTPDSLLQLPHGEATFPSLLMSPPPPPHEQSEQSLPSYFQRRPRRSAGLGFSKLRPTKSPPTISSPASASMDNLADFMTMLPTSQSNQPASDFDSALGLSIPDMKGPSNMFGLDLGIPLPESPNLSHLPRTTLLLPPPYTPFNIATAESSGPSSAAPAQLRDVLLEQFDWDTLTEFINAQLPAQSRSPAPDGAVQ